MPETMPAANDVCLVHLPARRPTSKQFKVHSAESTARSAIGAAKHYARPPFRARLFKQSEFGGAVAWELIEEWGVWDE